MRGRKLSAQGHESLRRLQDSLRDALGARILEALADAAVVEIMLNPDGKLFEERVGVGMRQISEMSADDAQVVIGLVAHVLKSEVDKSRPIVSGELPLTGERFEGLLPPVVTRPIFAIRKRAILVFELDDYVSNGIMTADQARVIREAVGERLNIIVSGGTGTGKTTLTNAVIAEIVKVAPEHRLLILEDTAEIQCTAENAVLLHTSDHVDMQRLLKSCMRLRPDRIIVGEVRDGAALTLLKAWNTGHPGGIATVHANSAVAALTRLEQLTSEASSQPMQAVIGEAVDLVVSIERTAKGRIVHDLLRVNGFRNGEFEFCPISVAEIPGKIHVVV
jgi:type IV secretion system protein VirB11